MKNINNNILESYVSYENAKLLKEAGFYNTECVYFYAKPNCKLFGVDEHGRHYPIKSKGKNEKYLTGHVVALSENNMYLAPTLQLAIDWISANFNIHILIYPYDENREDLWSYWIVKRSNKFKDFIPYKSKEEAKEAAIKYCLETLILKR